MPVRGGGVPFPVTVVAGWYVVDVAVGLVKVRFGPVAVVGIVRSDDRARSQGAHARVKSEAQAVTLRPAQNR